MAEPTGLFRHGGPLNRSVIEVFTSLGLDAGAPVLRAFFDAERPALNAIFRRREQWPGLFREFSLFPEEECDRAAARYLDWRADILYWKALTRIYMSELEQRVVVTGLDYFREAAGGSFRFMLLPFHIRQFPLLTPALKSLSLRYATIVSVNNPDDVVRNPPREQPGILLDSKDPFVLLRARQALGQDRAVIVYPDLPRGGNPAKIPLRFLGRQLTAHSSWHLFCLSEQLPAVPCFATAGPGNTVQLTIGKALPAPRDENEATDMVRRLYAYYEEPVRGTLIQWEGWAEASWTGKTSSTWEHSSS
ncbi:hypothetical protein [Streptomyces mesophilus]|uniref:hypothetical protein n=1 Tax=Streptomyces mesophilus TaxID=1775132 RepID=UPI0033209750